MKTLHLRIHSASQKNRIPQHIIEKDYMLSYILAGIASHPDLKNTLIFKGGTALKKLFFGEYRFSEDLDFSSLNSPKGKKLEEALRKTISHTQNLLSTYGPFSLQLERYIERDPHPHGQEAFIIRTQFPWHTKPLCRIKLEITHDELILLKPQKRKLIHEYEEELKCRIYCYRLEEIIAEKLRTLLQTHQKLTIRGWSRPRARDYYDLWRILDKFGPKLNNKKITLILKQKNKHRGVSYQTIDDFFSNELVSEVQKHWENTLGPFVNDLPECTTALKQLKNLLSNLLKE